MLGLGSWALQASSQPADDIRSVAEVTGSGPLEAAIEVQRLEVATGPGGQETRRWIAADRLNAGLSRDATQLLGGDAIVGTTGAIAIARGRLVAGVAAVKLVKSVSLRDPFGGTGAVPGAVATFTIAASVSGSGSVTALIVTDAVPAGTTYVPGTLKLDSAALSDAADGDAGTASNAAGVRVALGTVPAGTNRAITFDVVINP
jgi:uncharacterized repeat protein (TIGR01451 family)